MISSAFLLSFVLGIPEEGPGSHAAWEEPAFDYGVGWAAVDQEREPGPVGSQEALLDSIRGDLASGRSWRAARRFRSAFPGGPGEDEDMVLLLAKADAGWKNWTGVLDLLGEWLAAGEPHDSEGWLILGQALEGREEWEDAELAYRRFLASRGAEESEDRWEVQARLARVRGRLGEYPSALSGLEELAEEDSVVAGWIALEVAERAADEGSKEATRRALSMVRTDDVRELGWQLPPRALLLAGDSTGAEAAFWSALPSLDRSDQIVAWDRIGVLRIARGDTLGARGAFHQVLGLSASGGAGVRAAEALLDLGLDSVEVALAGARAMAGAGRHEDALEVYEIYEGLLAETPPPSVKLAQARSHLNLGRGGRALALAREVGESSDPGLGAPALTLQIQALRQLGRGGEARAVQDSLVGRFPQRPEAVEVLYNRASALQSRGDLAGAIRGYEETVAASPSQNLAGQARMRIGQIHMNRGREEEALTVYLAYLEDFPQGRRADEAAFWAGRLLFSLDRDQEAADILQRLRRDNPLSYYSVQAGDLLGVAFDPPIPASSAPLPHPGFLRAGMDRFDRLRAVGLVEAASWEAEALAHRIRSDGDRERRHASLLRLAHELNARGFTREGINLGWEIQRDGKARDRNLLEAIYPFPYREIVMAEGEERGVDPFTMAGLIRQESAFWAEARSRADARGLMQVLPSTGRELARVAGFTAFDADDHLFEAEINIHLGISFFVDMRRRFGDDLPIILSAYNAGPSRAVRWRRYPEAGDWPRFVERIPFTETRGYVKNVTANRAIYSWLYGPSPPGQ